MSSSKKEKYDKASQKASKSQSESKTNKLQTTVSKTFTIDEIYSNLRLCYIENPIYNKVSDELSKMVNEQNDITEDIPRFYGVLTAVGSNLLTTLKETQDKSGAAFIDIPPPTKQPKTSVPEEEEPMTTQQIKYIKNFVKEMVKRENNTSYRSDNSIEDTIVITEIFKHAKKEVKIYDLFLNDDVVERNNSFYIELINFVKAGGCLKVLLQNPEPESFLYYTLSNFAQAYPNVEIKKVNPSFQENQDNIINNDINFIINDKNAYWLKREMQKTSDDIKAKYSFNNEKISKKLNTIFENSEINIFPKFH